ncbi:hypothetical protein [Ruminococcus sp.]
MITSNVCRICSLEAEMTENTMRSDKAKSQYEALTKASVICPHENVLTIEEVD